MKQHCVSAKTARGKRWRLPQGGCEWLQGITFAAAVCLLFAGSTHATAQSWPQKEIKFVVGWPAGGGADVTARLFAEHLSKRLGQPIITDNRPGAGGTIGANQVIRAAPDGYTLFVGAISEISIATATNKEMPFNTAEDLTPVVQLAKWNHILLAAPDFPPNNIPEFVSYIKSHPGKVNYSTWGANTLADISGARLNKALQINPLAVPFKGSSPSLTALMGGHVQYGFDAPATSLSLIQSKKLKAIGILSPQRLAEAPEIPTLAEAGLPGFYVTSWIGLFAPKQTPRPLVDRLNKEVLAILELPEVRAALEKALIRPGGGTPDDFAKIIRDEVRDFTEVAATVGITQQ